MKTYIKYIITLFVLLFAVIIVQSQVRFNVPEVSQISGNKNIEPILSQFTATGDPVIKIHYLPASEEIIRVTSNEMGSMKIESGYYAELETKKFQYAIVYPDNEIITFPIDESMIVLKKNLLLTGKVNWETYQKTIKLYEISNRKFVFKGQIIIALEEHASLLDNGNVLITDQYELYGKAITLHNGSLELINSLEPFDEGFQSSIFTEKNNNLYFLIQNQENENLKLITIDALNGIILNINEIQFKRTPSIIAAASDQLVFWAEGEIVSIDYNGNILWKKPINLIYQKLILSSQQNKIIVATDEGIVGLSLKTGDVVWELGMEMLYHEPIIMDSAELPNITLRPIDIQLATNERSFNLLLSQTNYGALLPTYPKFNIVFYQIDFDATILKNQLVTEKAYVTGLFENRKIFIATDKTIISYEK